MCFGLAKAQTVSGNVSDDNGPLLGASVVVKGTANGTTADFDGNFTIQAGSGDILVFSYVGYTAQEVAVGNQTTINVVLLANNELDEVIVTGYGGQKEKEITSAVVSVLAKASTTVQVNAPITFTVTWSGNQNAGDVSPKSATPTTVLTDSSGVASITVTNKNPATVLRLLL